MTKICKRFSRFIACTTAVVFASFNVFAQVPVSQTGISHQAFSTNIPLIHFARQLEIPKALGEVTSKFVPQSVFNQETAPFFIHIQDAHTHYEAQHQIKEILNYLKNRYDIQLFGFEGAHEALDPSVLHIAQNPAANLKIAEYLVRKGELTGGEWFALEQAEKKTAGSEARFEGIENAEIYQRDLKLFRTGLANREKIDLLLERLRSHMDRLKSKSLNPKLLKFDRDYKSFSNRNETNLLLFFKKLSRQAREVLGIDLGRIQYQKEYPQLVRLSHLIQDEALLDCEKLNEELTQISQRIQSEPYRNLLKEFSEGKRPEQKPFATWRETFERLHECFMASAVQWSEFPHFRTFAKHLILEEELLSTELFQEIDALAFQVEMKMAVTEIEKALIQLSRDYERYQRVIRLDAGRDEVARLRNQESSFLRDAEQIFKEAGEGNLSLNSEERRLLDEQRNLALRFYAGAREREKVFVDRLIELQAKQDTRRLVFVTGGYHTQGIREELESRGIAYATISPNLTAGEEQSLRERLSNLYEESMLGRSRSIFDGSHILAELKLVRPEAYEALGARDRAWVRQVLEAVITVGLEDLALEIRVDPSKVLDMNGLAGELQAALRKNPFLASEQVQVAPSGDALVISWASFRSGYPISGKGLLRIAQTLNTADQEVEVAAAASLGDEGTTRRGFLKFLGALGLSGLLGGGCAARNSVKVVSVPIPIYPSTGNGPITELPKNNRTPTAQRAAPVVFQKDDNQGSTFEGDTSLSNVPGVGRVGLRADLRIDPNDPDSWAMAGFSWDDFMTDPDPKESADVSSPNFNLIRIFVRSNTPALTEIQAVIEDVTATKDSGPSGRARFILKDLTTQGSFYEIDLNNLPGFSFDRSRKRLIGLILDHANPSGLAQASVSWMVGGVMQPAISENVLFLATTNDVANTSDFSTAVIPSTPPSPPRIPTVTVLGGSNRMASVQLTDPNTVEFNGPTGAGTHAGIQVSTNDNRGTDEDEDWMNASAWSNVTVDVEFLSGSAIPSGVFLEVKDINGEPFRTKFNNSAVGNQRLQASLALDRLPPGFNLSRASFNVVFENETLVNVSARIRARGFQASPRMSTGMAFENPDTTSLATAGGTAVIRRLGAGTAVRGIDGETVEFDWSPGTTEVEIVPAPGTFFDDSGQNPIRFNLGNAASTLPDSMDIILRDVNSQERPVRFNAIPGSPSQKFGYTVFTNTTAIPPGSIDLSQITSRRIRIQSQALTGTLRMNWRNGTFTVQSLGAAAETQPGNLLDAALIGALSKAVTSGIVPEPTVLAGRSLGAPAATIVGIYEILRRQLNAAAQASEPRIVEPKAVKRGHGLEVLVYDRVPTFGEILGNLPSVTVQPDLFIQMVYVGDQSEELQAAAQRISEAKDYSGREIGKRFELVPVDRNNLAKVLAAMPTKVYTLMKKHPSLSSSPQNVLQLTEQMVFLGPAEIVRDVAYSRSVKIKDNLDPDSPSCTSDRARAQIFAGHLAVLTDEERASLKGKKELDASELFAADNLQAWANELQLYLKTIAIAA